MSSRCVSRVSWWGARTELGEGDGLHKDGGRHQGVDFVDVDIIHFVQLVSHLGVQAVATGEVGEVCEVGEVFARDLVSTLLPAAVRAGEMVVAGCHCSLERRLSGSIFSGSARMGSVAR